MSRAIRASRRPPLGAHTGFPATSHAGGRVFDPRSTELRFQGALAALSDTDRIALLGRGGGATPALDAVRATVRTIIDRVQREGDAALREMARQYDGAELATLEVTREALQDALATLDPGLCSVFERAVRNLATFHRAQMPNTLEMQTEPGVRLGRRVDPLARVGIYAPGGSACYASSVLMAAVPARVAGVREIVLCSPPDSSGRPAAVVLAAAALAGVDRVFALGGAGAIAALAYGTASVPRVDRIVGPGNTYVAEAKRAVAHDVAIDAPAGPSEILVLADESASPERVARELLAQAEHDPAACAVAVALGDGTAAAIERALADLLAHDPSCVARRGIIEAALAANGGVLSAASVEEAIAFANAYAPEHLLLVLADPRGALASVRNTGSVFLGDGASVAFGDYLTGANHVLPTGGAARSLSGLSTLDFVRTTTWQDISAGAAARLADDVALFAATERLPAHAGAALAFRSLTPSKSSTSSTGRARASSDGELAASSTLPRARALEAGALAPRASYDAITPYASARPSCAIDLSDNTNPFGAPPAAKRALRAAARDAATRYPSPYSDALRAALADYAGATPEEIVTGCGSDDVLDAAIRAFSVPGDRLAYMDPTFSMIPEFARMNGLEPVAVPLGRDFDADAQGLLATGARISYVCSPNNPTGTVISARALERLLENAGGLVILDLAYAEFAGRAALELPRSGRLLVVRTLSKAFGLAGLRIGYAIGAPTVIEAVAKARGPYKVNAPAERAAVAALEHDRHWAAAGVRVVRRNRQTFTRELTGLGFAPLPSHANFVLVPVPDAAAAAALLRERGIAVRPFRALTGIGDALRITIGRRRDMETVRDTLEAIAPALGIRPPSPTSPTLPAPEDAAALEVRA